MKYNVSYFCDPGNPLKVNQDRVLVNGEVISKGIRHINKVDRLGCFVADGIGSMINSEIAAQFVLDNIAKLDPDISQSELLKTLKTVNDELILRNRTDIQFRNSGCTLCGIVLNENGFFLLNIGDSEVLLLRDGVLNQLTDHQVVDSSVANSPITSFLGSSQMGMHPEFGQRYSKYRIEDLLIVCTDGLRKALNNKDLTEILNLPLPLHQKAENLYYETCRQNTPDNIGVILIQGEKGIQDSANHYEESKDY